MKQSYLLLFIVFLLVIGLVQCGNQERVDNQQRQDELQKEEYIRDSIRAVTVRTVEGKIVWRELIAEHSGVKGLSHSYEYNLAIVYFNDETDKNELTQTEVTVPYVDCEAIEAGRPVELELKNYNDIISISYLSTSGRFKTINKKVFY